MNLGRQAIEGDEVRRPTDTEAETQGEEVDTRADLLDILAGTDPDEQYSEAELETFADAVIAAGWTPAHDRPEVGGDPLMTEVEMFDARIGELEALDAEPKRIRDELHRRAEESLEELRQIYGRRDDGDPPMIHTALGLG